MAKIVLGIGTSHSPMLAISSEFWPAYAQGDSRNRELLTVKGVGARKAEDLGAVFLSAIREHAGA